MFRDIVTETASTVLGPKEWVHQDWFDENDKNINEVINAKDEAFTEWQNHSTSASKIDKFGHLKSKVQAELWEMQDKCWQRKAEEVWRYADLPDSEQFFHVIESAYGPSGSECSPLLSADGSTLI